MSGTMDGFAEAAAALNAARDAWQADLRKLNAAVRDGTATGADVDAIMARDDEISARVELLRRRYFPRADRLVIGMGAAITVSKTGRSTRRVWSAPPIPGGGAMEKDDNDFISPEQAADLIGITIDQLAQLRYKGGGPVFYKPHGRLVRYRRREVLEWHGANRRERTDGHY